MFNFTSLSNLNTSVSNLATLQNFNAISTKAASSKTAKQNQHQGGATSANNNQGTAAKQSIQGHSSRKTKQSKKQMQQDLINLALWKHKDFRVFYGLIAADDDSSLRKTEKSIINDQNTKEENQTSDKTDNESTAIKFTADNNSYNSEQKREQDNNTEQITKQPSNSISGPNQRKPILNSDCNIKEWFSLLNPEQRVNALTTTSPYLSEVLINMQRQIAKKGTMMFAQTQNSGSARNYQMAEAGGMGFNQHYSQGYGPQYFLASNSLYQSQLSKYSSYANPDLYGYHEENEDAAYKDIPQHFEDCFYCRTQQKTETEKQKENEPDKLHAFKQLADTVRFCDLFQYLDTISVSPELVKDPAAFFEVMSNSTNGQAFSSPCHFEHDKKLGIHTIESPNWFKPERFHCFSSWIAAIFEENLWANYNYQILKNQGLKNINIEYLFDLKEMQDGWDSLPLIKHFTLAECWLNSTQEQKQSLIDNLQTLCNPQSPKVEIKDFSVRHDFFLCERLKNTLNDADLQEIINVAKKLTKSKKQSKMPEAVDFIVCLYQSGTDRIEKSADIINRTFLKLIQQMYQEQVIDELLVGNTPVPEKHQTTTKPKRKRKKNKEENSSSGAIEKKHSNPLNQNSDLIKIAEIGDQQIKSEQENNKLIENKTSKQNMNDLNILQNSSLGVQQIITSDASGQSDTQNEEINNDQPNLLEKDSDNENSQEEDEVDEVQHSNQTEQINTSPQKNNKKIFDKLKQVKSEHGIETDMKKISSEYVSDMLDKIETESKTPLTGGIPEDEFKTTKSKNGKKRKRKEQESKEVVEESNSSKGRDEPEENNESSKLKAGNQGKTKVQANKPTSIEEVKRAQTETPAVVGDQSPTKLTKKQKKDLKQEASGQNDKKQKQMVGDKEQEILLQNLQKSLVLPQKQSQQLQKQTSTSIKGSRQGSAEPSDPNPESEGGAPAGGRRRHRKKPKNDPQEIMNQFIKQNFDSKKDENYGKYGPRPAKVGMRDSKNNSRIMSRKTSPLKQSATGATKTASYVQPAENKNQTIIFNEPQAYHKKTQSAVIPQNKKKKNKEEFLQSQKRDQYKGLPPKQNMYQEKNTSGVSLGYAQLPAGQGQPPKPKKKKSPQKMSSEPFVNIEFGEHPRHYIDEVAKGDIMQSYDQLSEVSDDGFGKSNEGDGFLKAHMGEHQSLSAVQLISNAKQLLVTQQLSSKSEVIISSVEDPQVKLIQRAGQEPGLNPHLLHTTSAISQINANSPSFRPSKHHSAVFPPPVQEEENKLLLSFETHSLNVVPVAKQNSLQHMAQNLKKVKSFNPNNMSGYQNFGTGPKPENQTPISNIAPEEQNSAIKVKNSYIEAQNNMNKIYQNQNEVYHQQTASSLSADKNRKPKAQRKSDVPDGYLQDQDVDNQVRNYGDRQYNQYGEESQDSQVYHPNQPYNTQQSFEQQQWGSNQFLSGTNQGEGLGVGQQSTRMPVNNQTQDINISDQIGNIGSGQNTNMGFVQSAGQSLGQKKEGEVPGHTSQQPIYMPKQVYTTTTTTEGTVPNVNYQYPQGLQELINNATGLNNQSQMNSDQNSGAEDKDGPNRFFNSNTGATGAQQQSPQQFMMAPGFGQVSGNIGQINQVNSYNINQFGNLNLGQSSNNNFGNGMQNMPNQFQNIQNIPNLGNMMNMPSMQYQNFSMPQMNSSQNTGPQNLGQSNPFCNINQQPQQNQQPPMMVRSHRQYYDYNMNQNIEYKFYEKFDNDIYDEVNKIQQGLDMTKEERTYILGKLQIMCEDVFKQTNVDKTQTLSPQKSKSMVHQTQGLLSSVPAIKQYGSLVTGLALESSDMDMAVTNLSLPDREQMIVSLDLFAERLQKWEMIEDLNAISTASVPVIKAVVDLNKLREKEFIKQSSEKQTAASADFGSSQNTVSSPGDQRKNSDQYGAEVSRARLPDILSKLKIDITFDDSANTEDDNDFEFMNGMMSREASYGFSFEQNTHKGLASCRLIKNYVEHYKCLKEVSIILKLFLDKMDLNSPYHGGVSSYSTVLLLVAYMNKWNLKMSATLTPARLLMGFLDYYSYYFNVSLFGIDVSNNGSFYELSSPESNFVILDPLNEQNNTTKNSFLTHEIIKSFRKAFNSLKNLLLQYQQMQNSNITDNLVEVILRDSDKTEESLANQILKQQKSGSANSLKEDQVIMNNSQQPIQIQIQQIQQIQILQQLQH